MNFETVFARLIGRLESLERVVQRQAVRNNNMFREATVKSVDPETGLAVVEAHGIETKPVPWMQQAGAVNEWTPLSEGQRVMLVSPGGDMGRAFIMPGGFTDDTPAPHNKAAEKRVTIGGAVITHSAAGLTIDVDGVTFKFTGAGFEQTGGKQEHDGLNVGSTHVHGGVLPGPSDTAGPH